MLPPAEAGGGPIIPIFDEDFVSIYPDGDNVYIAPVSMHPDMVSVYGSATIDTLANAINNAPVAGPNTTIVMHGCEAAGGAVTQLENKGYDTSNVSSSCFPGCTDDTTYTD